MVALVCLLLAPGQLEAIDAPGFARDVQVSALTATVRVVNVTRNIQGSGVVVGVSGPLVYILTANHVVDRAERLEIHTFSADSYPKPAQVYRSAEVLAQAKDLNDLALVRLSTTDRMPGRLRPCPVNRLPAEKSVPVLAVGCGDGKAPTCLADRVEKRKVRRPGGETGLLWEGKEAPTLGRSGGPLLDGHGRLLGICSGTNNGKGYYCPVEAIHTFLRRNGLKWLYEEP